MSDSATPILDHFQEHKTSAGASLEVLPTCERIRDTDLVTERLTPAWLDPSTLEPMPAGKGPLWRPRANANAGPEHRRIDAPSGSRDRRHPPAHRHPATRLRRRGRPRD